ncbi:bifunctional folylpolyglutamate synthase/dihydrofolate synthase [Streptococcus dentiloxodontae]
MTYQETLDFIHAHKANGRRPNLERMNWLLKEAGNPQKAFYAVHIVGTNGKGSTTSFLQHILTRAGYKTGTFTSPFITRFNERIAIDGQEISNQKLEDTLKTAQPLLQKLERNSDLGRPTEFELVTFLMLLYFAQEKVDIAVIEAGIGGLYDSTNVFSRKMLICTSIGRDHMETLGSSLVQIARHKVGALSMESPFIFGTVRSDVRQLFYRNASYFQAPTFELGSDFSFKENGRAFDFDCHSMQINAIHLKMLGTHQKANASLAAMAAVILSQDFPNIKPNTIKSGLEESSWPGRGELISPTVLLDGAHNPQGIQSLIDLLDKEFSDKTIHILFAGLKRKALEDMLSKLASYEVSVTSFDFPEALPLADYPRKYPKVCDYRSWLQKAWQATDQLYVVTGSLYFISEVRNYLINQK